MLRPPSTHVHAHRLSPPVFPPLALPLRSPFASLAALKSMDTEQAQRVQAYAPVSPVSPSPRLPVFFRALPAVSTVAEDDEVTEVDESTTGGGGDPVTWPPGSPVSLTPKNRLSERHSTTI